MEIPLEFYYALLLYVLVWYVSEFTAIGLQKLFVGCMRGRRGRRTLPGFDQYCAGAVQRLGFGDRHSFLGVGITGLEFMGGSSFVRDMFFGVALVLAVTLSQLVRGREEQQFQSEL
ncbi:hypothetical protein [Rhodopila sp.]|uniref:hypothetical protein n=1 Tax=Rhodopila sp. TaxID=2480087 RepID=UPI003D13DED3